MSVKKKTSLQPPQSFQYRVMPGSGNVLWPVLEITFKSKAISLPQPLFTLVDSGASCSILHPFVAEALGFDLKKLGQPVAGGKGVGGTYSSWELPEPVTVAVKDFSFVVNFTVVDNDRLLWPCILGEDSIFDVARIDFYRFLSYFDLHFRTDIN